MLNPFKIIELFISLVGIVLSNMLTLYFSIPIGFTEIKIIEIPLTWQIPLIIFLTLTFKQEIILTAYSIYIFIGLFVLPVFSDGGSLGYLLLPNFGYLLGIFLLINSFSNLNKAREITTRRFLESSLNGLLKMHTIGIIYIFILFSFYDNLDMIFYNIGRFTISKLPYQLLMLLPLIVLLKYTRRLRI